MLVSIAKPTPDEYPAGYAGYVGALDRYEDVLVALREQREVIKRLRQLSGEQAGFRYSPGKWTVRDVIGHVTDGERIFGYRLLAVARGEVANLPNFDENDYAINSNANARTMESLVADLLAARESTLALVSSLDDGMLSRRGTVRGHGMTVRGLAAVTAGHLQHHLNVLRERYKVL